MEASGKPQDGGAASTAPPLWTRLLRRWRPAYIPIAWKLAFVITTLITGGMTLLGLVIIDNQTELLREQMNTFGGAVTQQLADSSKELVLSDDILGLMVQVTNLDSRDSVLGAAVYNTELRPLAATGLLPQPTLLAPVTDADGSSPHVIEWEPFPAEGNEREIMTFFVPVRFDSVTAGYAAVSFSKRAMTQALQQTVQAVAAAMVLMILLGVAVSVYMGRRLSRPIHNLMDASRAIDSGDYSYRIQERRDDEIGYLIEAFNSMADSLVEKRQVESVFSRFVSPTVAQEILNNLEHVTLGGKHVEATAVFADIVGFTSIAEKLSPDEVASLLNEYFTYIAQATAAYGGTVDKYMGDCAMLIFGAPERDPEHRFHAVACAVLIQKLAERLNQQRQQLGLFPVHFRIGINSGLMLAGNMGAQDRMQYTVVGDAVNLAARLHNVAGQGEIVISELLYQAPDVCERIIAREAGSIKLRGKSEPVTTYLVRDLARPYRSTLEAHLDAVLADRGVA